MIVSRRRPIRRHRFPVWSPIFNEIWNAPQSKNVTHNERYSHPAVNVKVHDEYFELHLAAPGYTKADFNINIEKDQLIISSERTGTNDLNYKMREFNYGSFTKKFRLPEDVNAEGITASYNAGVLNVHIPKAEEVKPVKIDIK